MDLSAPDAHDVEDFLSSLMDQEFDTIVDDGSVPEVSKEYTCNSVERPKALRLCWLALLRYQSSLLSFGISGRSPVRCQQLGVLAHPLFRHQMW